MFPKLLLRWRSLFGSQAVDEELNDELRFHIEQQTQEFVRRGLTHEEAVRMAQRQFGNLTLHKEECRDARKMGWLEGVGQDFRQSVRTLRKNPGFTIVSVLTLALGIGATSAVFSIVDGALLHPFTAPEPERLVWLQEFSKGHSESGGNPARLADWQAAVSFSAVGGFYSEGAVWTSPRGPVQLQVLQTMGNLLGALAPRLSQGRTFTPEEIRGEGQPVALVSAQAFRQQFASDPKLLDDTLRLGTTAYRVVGIMAEGLDFPEGIDLWAPAPRELQTVSRRAGFLGIVARLAPGVDLKQAQAEIDIFSARLAKQYPDTDRDRSAVLYSLNDYVANGSRKTLYVLFGAAGSVLLIGCLNIAGLLLARGMARRRESAIRASVGAGSGRLIRLFFAESLLLAAMGCVFGLLLALLGVDVFKVLLPPEVPHLTEASVNWRVTLCAIGLSSVAALIFGSLPAWQFARSAQRVSLKDGGGGSIGDRKNRVRGLLVVCEISFSAMLLIMASLLGSSFLKLRSQTLGFNAAKTYTFALKLPWDTDSSVVDSMANDTLLRLNSFPGVMAAGVVDNLPLHGGSQSNPILVRGRTLSAAISEKEFAYRTASPGYFASAGIPLVAGSIYRSWNASQATREAVISDRLAELLFPDGNAIGHEICRPGPSQESHWFRIVGVIGSVRLHPTDPTPAAEVYVPWGATYWPLMNFVMRTERPLADVARYVHDQIQSHNGNHVFSAVSTLDERTQETRATPRTATMLIGSFAAVALALAALGIFGLMAQETARRTQEIGVRLALGAEPRSIGLDAVLRAVKLLTVGLVVGLAGAWFASGLVMSLLFEVEPHDLVSYASSAAVLLATAILAALWPAVRAARIDPIQALRHE